MNKNRFIIVVPFYNASRWIGKSIKSIMLQNYDNFSCIIADDYSTDNSYQMCKKIVEGDDRFTLIKTKKNLGPLGNAYEAATIHNKERDIENIIVILDGDDFFSSENTLSILNEHYNQNKCWMTYGSYINLSNRQVGKFSSKVPELVVKNNLYRQSPWLTSHLRSYKFGLLKNVQKSDIINKDGEYYKAAGDLAIMFPLLEMSGERAHFIKDVLYIWNDLNELNEHKDKRQLQISCEQQIRSLEKYKKLEEL